MKFQTKIRFVDQDSCEKWKFEKIRMKNEDSQKCLRSAELTQKGYLPR